MVVELLKIKNSRPLIILLIISILMSISSIVFAEKSLVFDEAGLFSEDEIQALNIESNRLSDEYNMDIVIVTTDNTMGKTSREFADDYFDYNGFGVGEDRSGILLLIDMDNREAYISTSGIGIRYLTDERIEFVLGMVFDNGLIDGDYHGAAMGFLEGVERYLNVGIPSNQYDEPEEIPKEKNRLTPYDLILSILGGIIAGGIFIFSVSYRYRFKKAKNPYSYRGNSIVNFSRNEDRLINTFVTHRIIPKPSNNQSSSSSGRSTTHTSSSGRTHGGGGRKF